MEKGALFFHNRDIFLTRQITFSSQMEQSRWESREQQCSPPLVFPRTKGARARHGWPLTSKSSIYDRFLAHFTCANNGRLHRSIIFIRRSNQYMYKYTRVFKYLFSPALHMCIYIKQSRMIIHFSKEFFSKMFDNRKKVAEEKIE